ncbi:Gfo/Idh/MocA family oxidoreductase [Sulfitobacter sp. D35]|uniref:Gfo/Idh/MocA family protein n=1 Tax=Sulfitobacter sp. D35 TaxID=3083252 RepID=UPI00296FDBB8|nr:Gfo/Idh/MocA family oxidoreductase [Sulfitobacter sp. D35]MDW4499919.1 Gfo/Idh/MocA family oxidoreductase [Sulfitobacter sp. D35]
MTKFRGALIGCGFFAENHLNAWAGLEGADLVAVCDLDSGRAKAAAEKFGVPEWFTDAEAMLKAVSPNFVDIATAPPTHLAVTQAAVSPGRVVICQKPMAETQADARAMVNAAEDAGASLIIHENFRWQRGFIEMKSLLDQGAIGNPHFAHIRFRHGFDVYANQPYLAQVPRLALMDVGVHVYDVARFLLGDVTSVDCATQRLNPDVKGEDAFSSLLRHDNGAVSLVDVSFYSVETPDPFPETFARIEGPEGTLELQKGYRLALTRRDGNREIDVEPEVPHWGEKPWHAVQDSVINFQRHVVDVLAERAAPQPSGADNLKTLDLALASYASAAAGTPVSLAGYEEAHR